ncbi:hypothetical protein R1sor_013851 [Riccia sorocarpa]|uniref:ER-bound oxygenase mpaB/mpaB'/Rubber oxygenase catalytic domain-containing protein n=1 Tax=Riccia sorocarpa TaxID=122646 RepID=A0ABD3H7S5_9MARC
MQCDQEYLDLCSSWLDDALIQSRDDTSYMYALGIVIKHTRKERNNHKFRGSLDRLPVMKLLEDIRIEIDAYPKTTSSEQTLRMTKKALEAVEGWIRTSVLPKIRGRQLEDNLHDSQKHSSVVTQSKMVSGTQAQDRAPPTAARLRITALQIHTSGVWTLKLRCTQPVVLYEAKFSFLDFTRNCVGADISMELLVDITAFIDSRILKLLQFLIFVSIGSFLVVWVVLSYQFFIRSILPSVKLILESYSSSEVEVFTWRSKFPSFENMHTFFDRGDAMLAAALMASSMQLSHEEVGGFLLAHSYFNTHPWRRVMRTLAFIRMTVRANSAERTQIIAWLNRIHSNIRLFKFETNAFMLATIAFSLAKAHQSLGCATDAELDALVSAIMDMTDKIDPKDHGKLVPSSLMEVETYLSTRITFKSPPLVKSFNYIFGHANVTKSSRKTSGISVSAQTLFRRPWAWIKLFLLRHLAGEICHSVLFSKRPGFLLSVARVLQPVWYHLHHNTCPHILTLDGLFDLLIDCDPSLEEAVHSVYVEVLGEDFAARTVEAVQSAPGRTVTAHLPHIGSYSAGDTRWDLAHPSLSEAVTEHLKCSFYRARLSSSNPKLPQHLGVIMDGNRRYSKENHLGSVVDGHEVGARKLLQFMLWSFSAGINNLTLWALSDDNLKRGSEELEPLFTMMTGYISEVLSGNTPVAVIEIRFRVVGDRSLLPEKLRYAVEVAEKTTQCNRTFNLQLALGYGGRAEVIRAVKEAVKVTVRDESITLGEAMEKLSAADVSKHVYSAELGLPEIDAILRTSGEKRLSGFALWESQAAELCFVDCHWPSMKQSDFLRSIIDLSERQRRFGA